MFFPSFFPTRLQDWAACSVPRRLSSVTRIYHCWQRASIIYKQWGSFCVPPFLSCLSDAGKLKNMIFVSEIHWEESDTLGGVIHTVKGLLQVNVFPTLHNQIKTETFQALSRTFEFCSPGDCTEIKPDLLSILQTVELIYTEYAGFQLLRKDKIKFKHSQFMTCGIRLLIMLVRCITSNCYALFLWLSWKEDAFYFRGASGIRAGRRRPCSPNLTLLHVQEKASWGQAAAPCLFKIKCNTL